MCPPNNFIALTHSFQPHLVAPKASTHIPLHACNFPHLNIRHFSSNSSKNLGTCRTALLSFVRSTQPEGAFLKHAICPQSQIPHQISQYRYFKKVQTEEKTVLHLLTLYIRAPIVELGELHLVPSLAHSSNHTSYVLKQQHYLQSGSLRRKTRGSI